MAYKLLQYSIFFTFLFDLLLLLLYIHIQSILVTSKFKGLSEILRDILISTYQICRIEEKR